MLWICKNVRGTHVCEMFSTAEIGSPTIGAKVTALLGDQGRERAEQEPGPTPGTEPGCRVQS